VRAGSVPTLASRGQFDQGRASIKLYLQTLDWHFLELAVVRIADRKNA
jgi:hypothetical protein